MIHIEAINLMDYNAVIRNAEERIEAIDAIVSTNY